MDHSNHHKGTSFCLTVDVQSEHIKGGLGFMIAFSLPAGCDAPTHHPQFESWSREVRSAVLAAGDLPFNPDPYTKKLALAGLMHDLAALNARYQLAIGGIEGTPAVQIHSANPFDCEIEIDFCLDPWVDHSGAGDDFIVSERFPPQDARAEVTENGKMAVIPAGRKNFPFDKPPAPAVKKAPAAKKPSGPLPPQP